MKQLRKFTPEATVLTVWSMVSLNILWWNCSLCLIAALTVIGLYFTCVCMFCIYKYANTKQNREWWVYFLTYLKHKDYTRVRKGSSSSQEERGGSFVKTLSASLECQLETLPWRRLTKAIVINSTYPLISQLSWNKSLYQALLWENSQIPLLITQYWENMSVPHNIILSGLWNTVNSLGCSFAPSKATCFLICMWQKDICFSNTFLYISSVETFIHMT